jgi:hypothetical protein
MPESKRIPIWTRADSIHMPDNLDLDRMRRLEDQRVLPNQYGVSRKRPDSYYAKGWRTSIKAKRRIGMLRRKAGLCTGLVDAGTVDTVPKRRSKASESSTPAKVHKPMFDSLKTARKAHKAAVKKGQTVKAALIAHWIYGEEVERGLRESAEKVAARQIAALGSVHSERSYVGAN